MNPLLIIINGQHTQIGGYLPTSIHSFSVTLHFPMQIPTEQVPRVKQWLNTIMERLSTDYVSYNDTIIPSSELNRF